MKNLRWGWWCIGLLPLACTCIMIAIKKWIYTDLSWVWTLSPIWLVGAAVIAFFAIFCILLESTKRWRRAPKCCLCVHCIRTEVGGGKYYCAHANPPETIENAEEGLCHDFVGSVTKGWDGSMMQPGKATTPEED